MILNKKQMAKRFNRAAKTYDQYAVIPRRMAHRLIDTCKKQDLQVERILEIGCGTGYCTSLLHELYPRAEIDAIDFAEQMIVEAERFISSPLVSFQVADAEEDGWHEGKKYDLIVLNSVIHWFVSPQKIIKKCYRLLNRNGFFIASTFGPDTFQEIHMMFEVVESDYGLEPAVHGLRWKELGDWKSWMKAAEFCEISIQEQWMQQHYPDCRHLLQTIKKTGASYSEDHQPLSVSLKVLPKVMEKYNVYFRDKKGVYATYHLLQLQGKKTDE